MYQASPEDESPPTAATLLLISGERVGASLVATTLRGLGHRVLAADTAAQGIARLVNAPGEIDAVVVVGRVRDATPEALRRWADSHGLPRLPIAAIGGDTSPEAATSGQILAILTEDWPRRAEEVGRWIAARTELPELAAT